ncbi:MAG: hypothetical protein ACPG19_15020 [Saprospiraceae bacterium]
MKKLLLLLFFVTSFSTLQAQVNDNLDYMQLRFKTGKGLGFTLQPYGDFHKAGFMGRKIKPYFKDTPEAMKAFNKYRWYTVGMYSTTFITTFGTTFTIIGVISEETNVLLAGLGGIVAGSALMVMAGNASLLNLQKAVDIFNKNNNPSLSQLQHFLPTLQPTASSAHVGLGLVWNIQ